MAASKYNTSETGANIRTKFNANADLIDANITAVAGKEAVGVAQALITALQNGNTTDTIKSLRDFINSINATNTEQANQISDIEAILSSDDSSLDTVQEIVDYIKNNRVSINSLVTDKLNASEFDTFVAANNTALGLKMNSSESANFVKNTTDTFGALVQYIVTLSTAEYDALAVKDATTLYIQYD